LKVVILRRGVVVLFNISGRSSIKAKYLIL
jgi:hypothetical protein